jgi:hypothetical protein
MKLNDRINQIHSRVRQGEDVDCDTLDLVKLIVAHINDGDYDMGDDYSVLLHPILRDITETSVLDTPKLHKLIAIGNLATRRIVEELLLDGEDHQKHVCEPRDLSKLIESIVETNALDHRLAFSVEELMADYDIDHDMATSLEMLIAVECWRPYLE